MIKQSYLDRTDTRKRTAMLEYISKGQFRNEYNRQTTYVQTNLREREIRCRNKTQKVTKTQSGNEQGKY